MAQSILLDENIRPGEQFVRELDRVIPITVAFWMKERERDDARLYVASPSINDSTYVESLREVTRVADSIVGWGIDSHQVRVLNDSDPRALDAIEIRSYQRPERTRAQGSHWLGNTFAEDVYVYPPLHPVAAQQTT